MMECKREGWRLIAITAIVKPRKNTLIYHVAKDGSISSFSISSKKPYFRSITDIYPTAEVYEREAHDIYGIEFDSARSNVPFLFEEKGGKDKGEIKEKDRRER